MPVIDQELYGLIDRFCSSEQISNLLREYQGVAGIKISAPSKEELIKSNLQVALDKRVVLLESVYDLIREAEENGSQHVFYYKPAGPLASPPDLKSIGNKLLGVNWQKVVNFPRIALQPSAFVFADLRLFLPQRKPLDWVLKIYGHEFADRATDIIKEIDETRYTREFIREEKRIVIVVRWNNPGLLEVRLPRLTDSRKQLKAWLETTWKMVGGALNPNSFTKWNLSKARATMQSQQKKYRKMYRCSHSRIRDGFQNVASFECNSPQGDLFASDGVSESAKRLTADDGECMQLRTAWLKSEKDVAPSRDVTTLIGQTTDPNEVLFTAQCSSRDMDYVTDQLRFFSK